MIITRIEQRCLLLCKGKNFKANHNEHHGQVLRGADVCYYAKVRILKQITTNASCGSHYGSMFVIMQR